MAWAERRPNGRWRGGYRDQYGRRRYTSAAFTSEHRARLEGNRLEGEARKQRVLRAPEMTWSAWRPAWEATREVEPSTKESDDARIARWIEPRWERCA